MYFNGLPVVATLQNQLLHYVHRFVKFVVTIVCSTLMNYRKDAVKYVYVVLKNVMSLLWVHSIEKLKVKEVWLEELTVGSSFYLSRGVMINKLLYVNDKRESNNF